jgi:hypothetical protein
MFAAVGVEPRPEELALFVARYAQMRTGFEALSAITRAAVGWPALTVDDTAAPNE